MSIEDVKDIKLMLLFSGLTQQEIAEFKGTSQRCVSNIHRGDTYKQVDID